MVEVKILKNFESDITGFKFIKKAILYNAEFPIDGNCLKVVEYRYFGDHEIEIEYFEFDIAEFTNLMELLE